MRALVEFYAGRGKDHAGRTLDEILAWKDDNLEYTHDYIQWLFPNREPSQFNSQAPVLTDEDIQEFRQTPFLIGEVVRSYERICQFYKIAIGPPYWWDDLRYAHNWLRMTRIILCMREFGLTQKADAFHEAVTKAMRPDNRTRAFWFKAAGKSVHP